jgi:hypothetical protein
MLKCSSDPLRLRSPQAIGLNLHLPKRIAFDAPLISVQQCSSLFFDTQLGI